MRSAGQLQRRIQTLRDIEAIRQLKHRLLYCLDHAEWDGFRKCLGESVTFTDVEKGIAVSGQDAVVKYLASNEPTFRGFSKKGFHLAHHPEIDITGGAAARAIWTLHYCEFDADGKSIVQKAAYFRDAYAKEAGEWKITSSALVSFFEAKWHTPRVEFQTGVEPAREALTGVRTGPESGDPTADMQELSDIQAIKRLKYKYWRCVDHHRWEDLRTCYADDAEATYMSRQHESIGADEIVRFLKESLTRLRKAAEKRGEGSAGHLGLHPEIEITGPTTAKGRWLASGGRSVLYYIDEYVKLDGQWKIQRSDNYSALAAQF